MSSREETETSQFEDMARRRLHEAGLRATQPRVLVYSLLAAVGGHRSVDQIVEMLREQGRPIPRMSVYNVVADLQAASLLMCADVGPGRALYEAGDVWHHHFVCRSCGRVEDVPCEEGRKPCLEPPPSLDAEVDEAQVIFRGLCRRCAPAKGPSG